jgi:WD40 repeat protein
MRELDFMIGMLPSPNRMMDDELDHIDEDHEDDYMNPAIQANQLLEKALKAQDTIDHKNEAAIRLVTTDVIPFSGAYSDNALTDRACVAEWCLHIDLLVIGCANGEMIALRMSGARAWFRLAELNRTRICSLAWQPHGQVLAAGYSDGTIRLLNAASRGQLLRVIPPITIPTHMSTLLRENSTNHIDEHPSVLRITWVSIWIGS